MVAAGQRIADGGISLRTSRDGTHWLTLLVLALFGGGHFLLRFGATTLNPGAIDWLLTREDAAQHYLGWLFYRGASWDYPPGYIPDYLAPIGTSVALMDSLPLLAIPLKMLNVLLPETFQYFGFWLFLNHVLQVLLAYALMQNVTPHRSLQCLGALTFSMAPPFLFRYGHLALSSHWLLIWALLIYFKPPARTACSFLRLWAVLWFIAALVHPYLMAMIAAMTIADAFRCTLVERKLSLLGATAALGVLAALLLGTWHAAGYFLFNDAYAPGSPPIQTFSLNLNALWNPLETSTLLKPLPLRWGQYEGYAYLGLGSLLLSLVALAIAIIVRPAITRREVVRFIPLGLFVAALLILALSNRVYYGERKILSYDYPALLLSQVERVRAMGRFIWPAFYLWITFILWTVFRYLPRRFAAILLLVALIGQAADIQTLAGPLPEFVSAKFRSRLESDFWAEAMPHFEKIVTYPPSSTPPNIPAISATSRFSPMPTTHPCMLDTPRAFHEVG
jgi:hypothetical protein